MKRLNQSLSPIFVILCVLCFQRQSFLTFICLRKQCRPKLDTAGCTLFSTYRAVFHILTAIKRLRCPNTVTCVRKCPKNFEHFIPYFFFCQKFAFYAAGSLNTHWNSKQCRPWSDGSFRSRLIWVCTVCICHFVRRFGVPNFWTFNMYMTNLFYHRWD